MRHFNASAISPFPFFLSFLVNYIICISKRDVLRDKMMILPHGISPFSFNPALRS